MNALYGLFLDREDDTTYTKMCALLEHNNDKTMSVLIAKQAAKSCVHLATFKTLLGALDLKPRHYLDLVFWSCSSSDESKEHLEIVQYLLDLVKIGEKDLGDCLLCAVDVGNINLCNFFIDKGANINSKNVAGETVLHIAVLHSYFDIFKLLIKCGADVSIVDERGLDVLQLACVEYKPDIVEFLLNAYSHLGTKAPDAYDLLGCRALTLNVDDEKALSFWKRAQNLRPQSSSECNSVDELEVAFRKSRSNRIKLMFRKISRIRGMAHVMDSDILFQVFKGLQLEFGEKITVLKFLMENFLCNPELTQHLKTLNRVDIVDTHLHTFCIVLCHYPDSIDTEDLFFFLSALTLHVEQTGIVTNYVIDCFVYLINVILHVSEELTRLSHLTRKVLALDVRNQEGDTILHSLIPQKEGDALRIGNYFPQSADQRLKLIMEFFLECGSNPNVRNKKGETVLHLVSQSRDCGRSIVDLLLKYEAHIDLRSKAGERADCVLARRCSGEQIHLLPPLQCLASRAIIEYEIPYEGKIPKQFNQFVSLH